MIDRVLEHLRALVAADTSDPRRTVSADHAAVTYAASALHAAGCDVSTDDLGDGCVNVLGVRGRFEDGAGLLINCHLDTVAADPAWSRDPFDLRIAQGRATGLGACDIKGAAACVLTALERTEESVAVLFTTDEEGGQGRCVGGFTDSPPVRPGLVVVAEPTGASPVLQHRGFASFEVEFGGSAGHTSGAGAAAGSAVHKAVRWGQAALELAEADGPLAGARFNIGIIEGGRASNVVASRATLRFGFRPEPGADSEKRIVRAVAALKAELPGDGSAEWTDRFVAPPLTAREEAAAACALWGLDRGPDVDFWTEAALFAAAGFPSVVLGPGDIAQAHAADEFVEVAQLEACVSRYAGIVRTGPGVPGTCTKGAALAP